MLSRIISMFYSHLHSFAIQNVKWMDIMNTMLMFSLTFVTNESFMLVLRHLFSHHPPWKHPLGTSLYLSDLYWIESLFQLYGSASLFLGFLFVVMNFPIKEFGASITNEEFFNLILLFFWLVQWYFVFVIYLSLYL